MTALLLANTTGANEWAYVALAYVVVVLAIVAYVGYVVTRGRRLGRQLPPEDRRWM